ncbi:MAG: glycosyltransferase family 4 protein [Mariniphaga sp.]
MNILFCSTDSAFACQIVGGAETSMRFMAEVLTQTKNKPIYLTFGPEKHIPFNKPKFFNGVKIYTYSKIKLYYLERLARRLGSHVNVTLVKVINEVIFRLLIIYILKWEKIDVVYTYYEKDLLLKLLNIRSKYSIDVKFVLRMAGLYWYEDILRHESFLPEYEHIFNEVDSINYLSPSQKKLVEMKINDTKMTVHIKNSFICDIGSGFAPIKNINTSIESFNTFKIIVVSRFSDYQKRQDILIRAISLIKDIFPMQVVLIGNGVLKEEMVEMSINLGLSGIIIFKDYMPQEKLWQEMASADLLCHPCEYEGISKIILESMSMGIPVLASFVSPLDDYVFDGKNGFLVENEPTSWAKKILSLKENRELMKEVSLNAVRYIKENHDPNKNIYKYLEYFQSII